MSRTNKPRPQTSVTRQVAAPLQQTALATGGATVTPYALKRRQVARSSELVDVVARLDVVSDAEVQRQLLDWVRSVYAAQDCGVLIGLMSRCYLGAPYVDHRLSLDGYILEHYTPADVVPPGYTAARRLAQSGAYAYVEVYDDGAVVPIRSDGSVVF